MAPPREPATFCDTDEEVIALAKAQPGKLTFASSGAGASNHLAGELFKTMAGVNIVHVPYKGDAQATADLIGGQGQMMFTLSAGATPHIRGGKVRPIALLNDKRSRLLPDIPTVAETLPGFEANGWFALFAPAGTPPEIVQRLNAEVNRILDQPEVKQRYADLGAITVGGSPEKLRDQVKAEVERWAEVIRLTQMKVE